MEKVAQSMGGDFTGSAITQHIQRLKRNMEKSDPVLVPAPRIGSPLQENLGNTIHPPLSKSAFVKSSQAHRPAAKTKNRRKRHNNPDSDFESSEGELTPRKQQKQSATGPSRAASKTKAANISAAHLAQSDANYKVAQSNNRPQFRYPSPNAGYSPSNVFHVVDDLGSHAQPSHIGPEYLNRMAIMNVIESPSTASAAFRTAWQGPGYAGHTGAGFTDSMFGSHTAQYEDEGYGDEISSAEEGAGSQDEMDTTDVQTALVSLKSAKMFFDIN